MNLPIASVSDNSKTEKTHKPGDGFDPFDSLLTSSQKFDPFINDHLDLKMTFLNMLKFVWIIQLELKKENWETWVLMVFSNKEKR